MCLEFSDFEGQRSHTFTIDALFISPAWQLCPLAEGNRTERKGSHTCNFVCTPLRQSPPVRNGACERVRFTDPDITRPVQVDVQRDICTVLGKVVQRPEVDMSYRWPWWGRYCWDVCWAFLGEIGFFFYLLRFGIFLFGLRFCFRPS